MSNVAPLPPGYPYVETGSYFPPTERIANDIRRRFNGLDILVLRVSQGRPNSNDELNFTQQDGLLWEEIEKETEEGFWHKHPVFGEIQLLNPDVILIGTGKFRVQQAKERGYHFLFVTNDGRFGSACNTTATNLRGRHGIQSTLYTVVRKGVNVTDIFGTHALTNSSI